MILIRAGGLPFSAWQKLVSGVPFDLQAEQALPEAAARVQTAFDEAVTVLPGSDFRTKVYNARKAFFKNRKMPPASVMAGIESRRQEPVLDTLYDCLQRWQETVQWAGDFEQVYADRLASEWSAIQQVAGDANFCRALLFASHDLLRQLPAFCAVPVQQFSKKERNTAISVVQYLSRAVFKTSPFGRFTTVQLWRTGHDLQREFEVDKVSATPSVALLPALYEVLLREPAFYRSLEVALNPCIPHVFSETETLSWLYFDGEQEAFQHLEPNPVIALVLRYLLRHERSCPFAALMSVLTEAVEAAPEQLEALLFELISFGLLEWRLPEKGMSPSWCGNLYQYLAFLPSAPVLTDAAFLLQSLRISARALAFQTVEEAQRTQQECKQQMTHFFGKYNAIAPPVPAEQMFFEDVERQVDNTCPEMAIHRFVSDLSHCWRHSGMQELPEFRARLFYFTEKHLEIEQTIDFQAFCVDFFDSKTPTEAAFTNPFAGQAGAMLQVYRHEGSYRAVVNAMFPGGGKLFARWMHLFTPDFRSEFETWNDSDAILFPWQGWSNANFQSIEMPVSLLVPDARTSARPNGKALLLSDLGVRRAADGPELVDKTTGKRVVLTDLGLEAPESRPPVIQVLWHLGVPYLSSLALVAHPVWEYLGEDVAHRQRVEYESLVLAREAWKIQPAFFEKATAAVRDPALRFRLLRGKLSRAGIPRYFFARSTAPRQKPQFFDVESPVSMLIFEKTLQSSGLTALYIEEMLPTPDQWVLGAQDKHVGEFVVEFFTARSRR